MAGDWIKMRSNLAEDPAVICIAWKVGLDEFAVVGRLQYLWSWFDAQSRDGHARGVTASWVNRKVQRDGFAEAMVEAGWLVITDEGINMPNFDRHNGETAKERAQCTKRKQKQRSSTDVTPDVTVVSQEMSRCERDKSETREEKRREENSSSLRSEESRATRLPDSWEPSPELMTWAANERRDLDIRVVLDGFRDYWKAQPGVKGRKTDWPATFRNWVRNQRQQNQPRGSPSAPPWVQSLSATAAALTGRPQQQPTNPIQQVIDV